jgi:ABC-type transporter MlaC component
MSSSFKLPRLRHAMALAASISLLAVAAPAHADEAQGFIEQQHQKLFAMLRAPASPARDTQVNSALDTFVDFKELVPRAFGEPCHASLPNCEDMWAHFDKKQQGHLFDLLKAVVEKNYRKNLSKTLDYDVTYKGSRDAAGDTRVLTEAKSKTDPHEAPTRIDYIVRDTPQGPRVVDIVTEGSSFTKNLYNQIRQLGDYDKIVTKLTDKLADKHS